MTKFKLTPARCRTAVVAIFLSMSLCSTLSAQSTPAASPMFGMMTNHLSSFPTVNFGEERFWDAGATEWVFLNPSSGTFTFGALDTQLAALHSHNVNEAFYTLGRTPGWANGHPSDTICANNNQPSGTVGECYPPTDVNTDGTGTNLIWRNWVAAIAVHANDSTYLSTHAHIKYWEVWNEVDNSTSLGNTRSNAHFYEGTFAQLLRMTQDLRCILKGGSFTIAATGETCAQVWATVTSVSLSGPIDTSAQILMPSSHSASLFSLDTTQRLLYCTPVLAGVPCTTGSAGAAAIDVVNSHMKAGNAPTVRIEDETIALISATKSRLVSPETTKPFFNGESGYGSTGWPGSGVYADPDNQASFIPRYFLISWSKGISSINWYTWDISNTISANSKAIQAWNTTYNWMVGSTLTTPCSASGSIWTCELTLADGSPAQAIWESDTITYACSRGSCPTSDGSVNPRFIQYRDLSGNVFPISGGKVPIGIKPVLVENAVTVQPPTNLKALVQ